jgi:hypothetical protein
MTHSGEPALLDKGSCDLDAIFPKRKMGSSLPETSTLLMRVHTLFHTAFRKEIETVRSEALRLEDGGPDEIRKLLKRYSFLYSCYKFHSTAEDQVRDAPSKGSVLLVTHVHSDLWRKV